MAAPRCTTECAEDFKRIEAEKAELVRKVTHGDFRWLIEAPGQWYLSVSKLGQTHEFKWTQYHNRALCFRSFEQADMTMMAVRDLKPSLFGFATTLGDAKAVEHAWVGGNG